MALYEYQCESCGERMEVMQSFSDPAPACEFCGGPVKKLLSAPAVQFKGSGWYVNDYGRGGKVDTGGAAEKAAEKAGEKKGDAAAADSKSDAKADSKASESRSDSKSSESKSSEASSAPAPAPAPPARSEGSSGTP